MPLQSFPIYGIVYDNNRVPLVGIQVYLIDTTTREQLSTNYYSTTNSSGEYELNMANLSDYTDGDNYEVIAISSGLNAETRRTGTVNIAGGGDELDIFMEYDNNNFSSSVRDLTRFEFMSSLNSRFKKAFQVWSNNKQAGGSTAEVITSGAGWGRGVTTASTPVINLSAGQVCYVEQLTCMVRTASKVCAFEVVKCSGADGTGTATAVSGRVYEANGTLVEAKPFTLRFANPIRIDYNSTNALSIGIQITATDSSTYVDFILEGSVQNE